MHRIEARADGVEQRQLAEDAAARLPAGARGQVDEHDQRRAGGGPGRIPGGGEHVVLVAGDNPSAKEAVEGLLGQLGWGPERVSTGVG
jgi:hypothetical protein